MAATSFPAAFMFDHTADAADGARPRWPGVAYEQGGPPRRAPGPAAATVFGRSIGQKAWRSCCLPLPGLALFLIVLPRIYGFSLQATIWPRPDRALPFPFILSVSLLGQFCRQLVHTARKPRFSCSSRSAFPMFFFGRRGMAGGGDTANDSLRQLYPSKHLRHRWAWVRVNQMGASLTDVLARLAGACGVLTGVYAVLCPLPQPKITAGWRVSDAR